MPRKRDNEDNQPQVEKFAEAARELGCGEDEAASSLRKVAGSPGDSKRAKRGGGEGVKGE